MSNGNAWNGLNNVCHKTSPMKHPSKGVSFDPSEESFEEVPLVTACLTYMGFYLLMILGYVNQLFFTPNVATEKNRDVSMCNRKNYKSSHLKFGNKKPLST